MEQYKSKQIKLESDVGLNVNKEVELCDEIKIEIKQEPDDSSEECEFLLEDNKYLSTFEPEDSISKLNMMFKPYICRKRQNNFGSSETTGCNIMKSVNRTNKTKTNPKDTLGPYLAHEINKVTCPHLNQELTLKVHLLIGEYVKKQIEKDRSKYDDSRIAELPSDDAMEESKSQQVKLEIDVGLNEPMETATGKEDIKVGIKAEQLDKEVVLCDEIRIEIKEEPDDSTEEAASIPQDLYKFEPVATTLKLNTKINFYFCEVCNKSFGNKTKLIKHLVVHSARKKHSCNECNKSFKYPSHLKQHKDTHLGLKPFSCDVCNKTFGYASTLQQHQNTHLILKPFSCDECSKTFSHSSTLKQHKKKIHLGIKPFSCNECMKTFSQPSHLKRHKNTHLELKPFSCNQCNKTFSHGYRLKQHENTHSGLKPFSCDHCNKTFNDLYDLKRHTNTHLGLKPYSCDECKKTFSQSFHLKQHKNTHLGLKPFACNQCYKTFGYSSALKQHINIHLGIKPFSCDKCDKSFSQSGSLKLHQKSHLE